MGLSSGERALAHSGNFDDFIDLRNEEKEDGDSDDLERSSNDFQM